VRAINVCDLRSRESAIAGDGAEEGQRVCHAPACGRQVRYKPRICEV